MIALDPKRRSDPLRALNLASVQLLHGGHYRSPALLFQGGLAGRLRINSNPLVITGSGNSNRISIRAPSSDSH